MNIVTSSLLMSILMISSITLAHEGLASPSFIRQETTDEYYNAQIIDPTLKTASPLTDVVRVTYVSDGKILNVTIWLNSNITDDKVILEKRMMHRYGIYIDADSNGGTGANGIDYVLATEWNPDNKTWTETLSELTSDFQQRILYQHSYPGFFDDRSKYVPNKYITFTLDLRAINFPTQYKLAAFAFDIKSIDITHWIPIPPPEFDISTSQPSVVKGGRTAIDVQIHSTKGYQPRIYIHIEKQPGIYSNPVRLDIPNYGINSTSLDIGTTGKVNEGPQTLTLIANATFPMEVTPGPYKINSRFNKPLTVENITTQFPAKITVMSFPEYILATLNPFSGIYQAVAPIATAIISGITAIATWLITRKRNKR